MYKTKHFRIEELVSKQVYDKYKDTCWQFFDPRILITIDRIREELNKPITINNWKWNGKFQQRGLRANLDPIVRSKKHLYLSAHCLGQAVDFDVKGMTAEQVRMWLKDNQSILPYNIRIEKDVNWVHLDIRDTGSKIYEF